MSVEKVSTILKMADEANTTAIAFNCTDYNTIVSVVKVAEELSALAKEKAGNMYALSRACVPEALDNPENIR